MNSAPTSPRIAPATFLEMSATALGSPSAPLLSNSGPTMTFELSTSADWMAKFFNNETMDLTFCGNSLQLRRVKAAESDDVAVTAVTASDTAIPSYEIMDLTDFGAGVDGLFNFDKAGPLALDFEFLTADKDGNERPDLKTQGVAVGVFVPKAPEVDAKPQEATLTESCSNSSSSLDDKPPASSSLNEKRRVTFATGHTTILFPYYPTELEAKAVAQQEYEEYKEYKATKASRKLVKYTGERRGRRKSVDKPYGDLAQGRPSTLSNPVRFSREVTVNVYSVDEAPVKCSSEVTVVKLRGKTKSPRKAIAYDKQVPRSALMRHTSMEIEKQIKDWCGRSSSATAVATPITPISNAKYSARSKQADLYNMNAIESLKSAHFV